MADLFRHAEISDKPILEIADASDFYGFGITAHIKPQTHRTGINPKGGSQPEHPLQIQSCTGHDGSGSGVTFIDDVGRPDDADVAAERDSRVAVIGVSFTCEGTRRGRPWADCIKPCARA
jgi:hypothetical protein